MSYPGLEWVGVQPGVIVDAYLRNQTIRGELPGHQGRPLDVPNNTLESFVILSNACSSSLHDPSLTTALGTVRLQKEHVLLVMPYDPPSSVRGLQAGWVSKQPVSVMIGVGPFTVSGSIHIAATGDSPSLEKILRNPSGRIFWPMNDATVASPHSADWSLEAAAIFVLYSQIAYVRLLPHS